MMIQQDRQSALNTINQIRDVSDLYYLATLILSSELIHDEDKESWMKKDKVIPELAYLLDENSFKNLLNYYGGMTIQIPKLEDVRRNMYGILAYYYRSVKNYDWKKVRESIDQSSMMYKDCSSEVKKELSRDLKKEVQRVEKYLEGVKVPQDPDKEW